MLETLMNTIKNFDKKIKIIMINGLYFSLFTAIVASIILIYYIYFSPSSFVYYIGIGIMKLGITYAATFIASAIAMDKIKKDLV